MKKRKSQGARARHQVVVVLGEGDAGKRMRERVDRAARKVNKSLSAWARDVLMAEAGGPGLTDAGAVIASALLEDLQRAREHIDREIQRRKEERC